MSLEMMHSLVAPFSFEDIKDVIFEGPSYSAPGQDGFIFEFFKLS